MTASASPPTERPPRPPRQRRRREGGILGLDAGILALLLLGWAGLSVRPLGAFDIALWVVATLPLALSAMTQTFPILAGGQGLAAGATAGLVATIVAGAPITGTGSALLWIAAALAIGGAIGAFNGILIGYFRVPSTAVTVSTAVAVGGATQLIASGTPAAPPAEALSGLLFGLDVSGLPVVVIRLVIAVAALGEALRRSPWGHGLRLVGMRPGLAERMGVPAARLRAGAYAIAGLGSAGTGILLAAQLGAGDLVVGSPLLLQIYAAAAIGGSVPGLRGGSMIGALLGAAIVTATSNLLLPLGIDDYMSGASDALWLVAGIALCWFAGGHAGRDVARLAPPPPSAVEVSILTRPRETGLLHLIAGAAAFAAILAMNPHTDLPLIAFGIAVLALGQGAVMRAGGLDLAMPAAITIAGIAFVTLTQGRLAALPGALAVIAAIGIAMALAHAFVARRFARITIVATLATGGLLQAATGWLTVTHPPGFTPPALTAWLLGEGWPVAPVVACGAPLLLAMAWLLDHRRRTGDASHADGALGAAYALSTLAALLFGMMIAIMGGQAHTALGEVWLTPALAAIVIGGVPFRGGRGTLVGVMGGVLLTQAADTLLVRFGLGSEQRLIVFGLAMLVASVRLARPQRRPR